VSGKPVKVNSLAELKLVKREIEARPRQTSESDLFIRAVGVMQRVLDEQSVRPLLASTVKPCLSFLPTRIRWTA